MKKPSHFWTDNKRWYAERADLYREEWRETVAEMSQRRWLPLHYPEVAVTEESIRPKNWNSNWLCDKIVFQITALLLAGGVPAEERNRFTIEALKGKSSFPPVEDVRACLEAVYNWVTVIPENGIAPTYDDRSHIFDWKDDPKWDAAPPPPDPVERLFTEEPNDV